MNTGTSVMHCAHCGRPIGFSSIWIGDLAYHPECTRGPGYHEQRYAYAPNIGGGAYCVPAPSLSEADVRRIVREEFDRLQRDGRPEA